MGNSPGGEMGDATLEQKLNLEPQKRKREQQKIMLPHRTLKELQFNAKNSFLRSWVHEMYTNSCQNVKKHH